MINITKEQVRVERQGTFLGQEGSPWLHACQGIVLGLGSLQR